MAFADSPKSTNNLLSLFSFALIKSSFPEMNEWISPVVMNKTNNRMKKADIADWISNSFKVFFKINYQIIK